MIETLDDIIEELADQLGIYGSHSDGEVRICRVCWTADLKMRINRALEVERKLDMVSKGRGRYQRIAEARK